MKKLLALPSEISGWCFLLPIQMAFYTTVPCDLETFGKKFAQKQKYGMMKLGHCNLPMLQMNGRFSTNCIIIMKAGDTNCSIKIKH